MKVRYDKTLYQLFFLTLALFGASLAVALMSLYRTTVAAQTAALSTFIRDQSKKLETMDSNDISAQLRGVHLHFTGFGNSGEVAIARRDRDDILFLYQHRHDVKPSRSRVPWESELAAPMKRALSGETGTMQAADYHGTEVLAAYAPVNGRDWGIVAKIATAELREPFYRTALYAVGSGLVCILLCMPFFFGIGRSLTALLQTVFDTSVDAIMTVGENGGIIEWNRAAERIFGWDREEAVGRPLMELLSPANLHGHHANDLPGYLSSREPHIRSKRFELTARHKSGLRFPIELAISRYPLGERRHFTAIAHDITRRTAARERIEQLTKIITAHKYVNRLLATAKNEDDFLKDVCEVVAAQGIYRLAWIGIKVDDEKKSVRIVAAAGPDKSYADGINPTWADNESGLGAAGLCLRTGDYVHMSTDRSSPAHRPWKPRALKYGFKAALALPLKSEGETIAALKLYSRDQEIFTEEEITHLQELAVDISSGICALRARRERERLEQESMNLLTAIEQSEDAVVITDRDARITYVNPAFEKVTGYTQDEIMGKNPGILKSGRQKPVFYQRLWETLVAGKTWRGTFINKRKDGELIYQDSTISPVVDAKGKATHYVSIKRDITESMKLQERLIQTEKLSAVGQIAAGVAHEVNNPLTVILGIAQLLEGEEALPERLKEDVATIIQHTRRAGKITQGMLAFSRKRKPHREPQDLREVVKQTLLLINYEFVKAKIERKLDLGGEAAVSDVDAEQIQELLINLVMNAKHAMDKSEKKEISISIERKGDRNLIRVKDSGCGIPEKLRRKIFEPFFTTKPAGQGTGLGLSICYGIAVDNGGVLDVDSVVGEGTTFTIELPVYQDSGRAERPAESDDSGDV